jgi:hypothetical protein
MKKRNSPPRTESYFADRKARADLPKALKILKRAGAGKPPVKGDELPVRKKARAGER